MKRDALAFFRILPAGAADVGEVSREELRADGLGDWCLKDVGHDDLGDLFGAEFDELVPMEERPTDPGLPASVMRELKIGRAG